MRPALGVSWLASLLCLLVRALGQEEPALMPARLPNGYSIAIPDTIANAANQDYSADPSVQQLITAAQSSASLNSATPQNFGLTGSAFADPSFKAEFSWNAALQSAIQQQTTMKLQLGHKINDLEHQMAQRQRVVAAGIADLQRVSAALNIAQRQAFQTTLHLATAHRQLAALDVNTRRIVDTAKLSDLKKALALTTAVLASPKLTESQKVVNTQLATSIKDQISAANARLQTAAAQIDQVLGAKETKDAQDAIREAEDKEKQAHALWEAAQTLRRKAARANIVRASTLASRAHAAVDAASAKILGVDPANLQRGVLRVDPFSQVKPADGAAIPAAMQPVGEVLAAAAEDTIAASGDEPTPESPSADAEAAPPAEEEAPPAAEEEESPPADAEAVPPAAEEEVPPAEGFADKGLRGGGARHNRKTHTARHHAH